MRKYFQIILVSSLFFFALYFKDKLKITSDNEIFGSINKTLSLPSTPTPTLSQILPKNKFRDGEFKGEIVDAHYGNIQVEVAIEKGKIVAISFLDYPHHSSTSEHINGMALPILQSEAIAIQDFEVNIVTGASHTSLAFRKSLSSALSQAL